MGCWPSSPSWCWNGRFPIRHPSGLAEAAASFFSDGLSFVSVGIDWNNHHHLSQAWSRVTGGILWANIHLLFWLSLLPFATAWMGVNQLEQLPGLLDGCILLAAALTTWILPHRIMAAQGAHSTLRLAIGKDWKGKASLLLDAVASLWLVPDWRIERHLDQP
jgi:uncharacterized membrane protein